MVNCVRRKRKGSIGRRENRGSIMEFRSILFGSEEPEIKKEEPDFFKDLQLDYLVERILEQVKEYQTARYFNTFPKTKELLVYRQQIGRDLESEELCSIVRQFSKELKESRKVYQLSLKSRQEVTIASYYLKAADIYWKALLNLDEKLKGIGNKIISDGMKAFYDYVKQELDEQRKNGFEAALREAELFFSELKFTLTLDSEKLTVVERVEKQEEEKDNYFERLARLLGQEPEPAHSAMTDIFPDPLEMSYLEQALIELLKKSKPQVFQKITQFKDSYPEFYSDVLLNFEEEIQFYLSFQNFKERTRRMGYPMCVPEITEEGEFSGKEVYDLALVWKQEFNDYEVVSNQFVMKQHPCFFVVTGPNQGGKTTFARSVGQAVYFALMGLSANAEAVTMPMLRGISTHFEAEETLQSNSGKLKEEINRLKPMLKREQGRNQFVILNELFTTATTHDAMVMGRRVMESFLKRECYGIYVTHIQELAEETENIISLVAQMEPGQEIKRTYRMLPMKAQGYGYSDALVKKFHLEYEDIVRRLS